MLYKISGTFHFLGYDISIPSDIEASSLNEAKEEYLKKFSNFNRMNDVIKYLKENELLGILKSTPLGFENSALICIENIHSDEETINFDNKVKFNSLTFSDGSFSTPGLKQALKSQNSKVYEIKIIDHEPTILRKPTIQNIDRVTVENTISKCVGGKFIEKDNEDVIIEGPIKSRPKLYYK